MITQRNGTPGERPRPRGFASMDPARQRAIAAQGGRAAHAQGVAHEFDSAEARAAGRKGGQARGGARHPGDRDVQGADRPHTLHETPPAQPRARGAPRTGA